MNPNKDLQSAREEITKAAVELRRLAAEWKHGQCNIYEFRTTVKAISERINPSTESKPSTEKVEDEATLCRQCSHPKSAHRGVFGCHTCDVTPGSKACDAFEPGAV